MNHHVRPFAQPDLERCREILEALPDWFGLVTSNENYVARLDPRFSAVIEKSGVVLGFTTLAQTAEHSIELDVLAIEPNSRRTGLGQCLMEWAERRARENGMKWLHLKTRGPGTPDPYYAETRAFYLSMGYEPLFESTTEWGPDDAALVAREEACLADSRACSSLFGRDDFR